MAEELQNLLDRIQKDGVDRAEAEAGRILAAAKAAADGLTARAREEEAAATARVRREAQAFEERARVSLQQAARDVVLSVHEALNASFAALVRREVGQALTPEVLGQMLVRMAEAHFGHPGAGQLEVLLNPDDQKRLAASLLTGLSEGARRGMEVKADARIGKGFRLVVRGEAVEHDFTDQAIADAMVQFLRPQLAGIVKSALQGGAGGAQTA
jgi:V/A-type H+-transporting ATPase subunit E